MHLINLMMPRRQLGHEWGKRRHEGEEEERYMEDGRQVAVAKCAEYAQVLACEKSCCCLSKFFYFAAFWVIRVKYLLHVADAIRHLCQSLFCVCVCVCESVNYAVKYAHTRTHTHTEGETCCCLIQFIKWKLCFWFTLQVCSLEDSNVTTLCVHFHTYTYTYVDVCACVCEWHTMLHHLLLLCCNFSKNSIFIICQSWDFIIDIFVR